LGRPGGGPRGGGVELDPLVAAQDESKPLLSKLLAVPALRERYLRHVAEIAETWLDWNRLGPLAEAYHELIASEVDRDTRKLYPTESFLHSLQAGSRPEESLEGPGRGGGVTLKEFAERRRAFLLAHPEVKRDRGE
jgi:hypothetical protein